MTLRTRLNLVVATLSAAFVAVLILAEIQSTRASVREETEAANRVAVQLLGRVASLYSMIGGPELVLDLLDHLGRVRSNEIYLLSASNEVLYRSPAATYKAGREAPHWFARLLAPPAARAELPLRGGVRLIVETQPSRAVLDAWDDLLRLTGLGLTMLVVVNGLAFWSMTRLLRPFPIIAAGLERIERGELDYRLPPLPGVEAGAIGRAFNAMAGAVQDKVDVERKANAAENRLAERRELASLVDQRLEEERRLIAHELHDEFGQSVTAIRSLALAVARKAGTRDPEIAEVANTISQEAARLYDAMHGLIPRLAPLSLDTLGLAATLENLVVDTRRRHPGLDLRLTTAIDCDLGPSVTLALYRFVQEGLTNALRHGSPRHVEVDLRSDATAIRARVVDDGTGLPPDWRRPGHFGLRGLEDRFEQLGGRLRIDAGHGGRGVALSAEIALAAGELPEALA